MWYNIWYHIQDDIWNYIWNGICYDIQLDICFFWGGSISFLVSTNFVTLILEIHIRCHVRYHMKLHLTWHMICHWTGHLAWHRFFCVFNFIFGFRSFCHTYSSSHIFKCQEFTCSRTSWCLFAQTYLLILVMLFVCTEYYIQCSQWDPVGDTLSFQIIQWASPCTKSWIAP